MLDLFDISLRVTNNFIMQLLEIDIFSKEDTYITIAVPKNEDWRADIDLRVAYGMKEGQARGFIKSNDLIIVITGWSKGISHDYCYSE